MPLSEELACPICMDVLQHAYTTSCGHSFCGVRRTASFVT